MLTKSHVLCIVYLWVYYNRIIEDPPSGEDNDSGHGELSKSNKKIFFQKFHLVQFFLKMCMLNIALFDVIFFVILGNMSALFVIVRSFCWAR